MNAPYGQQGGHGPQGGPMGGPPPGWAPPPPRGSMGLGKILALVLVVLGLITMIMGFLPGVGAIDANAQTGQPEVESISVYGTGIAASAFVMLLFIAGLIGASRLLPKTPDYTFLAFVFSLGATLGLLWTVITVDIEPRSLGIGAIIALILGFFQTIVALGAWMIGTGIVKSGPRPSYGPQGYGPQSNGPQGNGPQGGPQGYGPQGFGPGQGGPQGGHNQSGPFGQQGFQSGPPTGPGPSFESGQSGSGNQPSGPQGPYSG